jgi:hypothetical protein
MRRDFEDLDLAEDAALEAVSKAEHGCELSKEQIRRLLRSKLVYKDDPYYQVIIDSTLMNDAVRYRVIVSSDYSFCRVYRHIGDVDTED